MMLRLFITSHQRHLLKSRSPRKLLKNQCLIFRHTNFKSPITPLRSHQPQQLNLQRRQHQPRLLKSSSRLRKRKLHPQNRNQHSHILSVVSPQKSPMHRILTSVSQT